LAFALVVATAAACSLTTSLEGYAGPAEVNAPDGSTPIDEAGPPPPPPPRDGGVDGARTGYRELVLSDGPLAYYRLGDTGDVAKDEVGGHDGRYIGPIAHGNGALKDDADRAAVFDGSSYVEIDDGFPFVGTAPFSIEAWALPEKPTSDPYCIAAKNVTGDGGGVVDGYAMYINDSAPTALIAARWRAGANDDARGSTVTPEVFTHVVATYDGQRMIVYANGEPTGEQASTRMLVTFDRKLTLGASRGGSYCYFRGRLDEVAIYGAALSEERIRAHYEAGRQTP
jgi:hypothetical protein